MAAIQLILIPHRPTPTKAEIDNDLSPAFEILKAARGLKSIWRGKKFEDRYTQVALVLWSDLASSHAFFTSSDYQQFHKLLQPAMNGRSMQWTQHVLLDDNLGDLAHFKSLLNSPAIEVATTKVVEGGVAQYYAQFNKVVVDILNQDPGCDGFFIAPLIENPEDQLLLINWKSVDAHHQEFEKRPGFRACIDALMESYKIFVVPWHITELYAYHSK